MIGENAPKVSGIVFPQTAAIELLTFNNGNYLKHITQYRVAHRTHN